MIEFYRISSCELKRGNFPLNHDCIITVEYHKCTGFHSQYFTCRAQDSGTLSAIFSSIVPISKVIISSVDSYGL